MNPGATFDIVPSGSTWRKYSCDRGWITKANLLRRPAPSGRSSRGSTCEDTIMSSRSSSVSSEELVAASIMASRTASLTVTGNGCGTSSSTIATPRERRSAKRSSEIADEMMVLPANSSRSNAASSS